MTVLQLRTLLDALPTDALALPVFVNVANMAGGEARVLTLATMDNAERQEPGLTLMTDAGASKHRHPILITLPRLPG